MSSGKTNKQQQDKLNSITNLSSEEINILMNMFSLFKDPYDQNSVYLSEMLNASQFLDLDQKCIYVFQILQEIQKNLDQQYFDKYDLLIEISQRIGDNLTENGKQKTFKILDQQQKGFLLQTDLQLANKQLGERLDEKEVKEIFIKISGDEEQISFENYSKYIDVQIKKGLI